MAFWPVLSSDAPQKGSDRKQICSEEFTYGGAADLGGREPSESSRKVAALLDTQSLRYS